MQWLVYEIQTTHEASEVITDRLSVLGADGVEVQDREEIRAILADPDSLSYADDNFVDSLDEKVQIRAYFARLPEGVRVNAKPDFATPELYDDQPRAYITADEIADRIRAELAGIGEFLPIGPGLTGWHEVKEEDWANNWKQYYDTLRLTDRLIVNPSWIEYSAAPDEIVISLDPGSAFGTGTHETTAMCAEFLDTNSPAGCNVLDLGTGSGILAILASRLDAAAVEAIDIDGLAVEVARENCRINEVPVFCHQGELKDAVNGPFDLIIANIIASVIVELLLQMRDSLIISGIIEPKTAAVLQAVAASGFRLLAARSRNDWHAYLLELSAGAVL